MGRRDRDHDARPADADDADPVVDRDRDQVVSLDELGGDPLHLGLGHALVRLVLELDDVAAARVGAGRADEGGDRTGIVRRDLADGIVDGKRLLGEAERSTRNGRDQRDFVALLRAPCRALRSSC